MVLCAAGSDLLGQCSAALASISIVFEKTDPSYALELLAHARDLYACVPNPKPRNKHMAYHKACSSGKDGRYAKHAHCQYCLASQG